MAFLAPYPQKEREEYLDELLAESWQAFDDEQAWDAQIEADLIAGRLDKLLAKADADIAAGRTMDLPTLLARMEAYKEQMRRRESAPLSELDRFVLRGDLPELGLQRGDVGTVVHVHKNNAAYEAEFFTLTGETIAVTTVLAAQVRPVRSRTGAGTGDGGISSLATRFSPTAWAGELVCRSTRLLRCPHTARSSE